MRGWLILTGTLLIGILLGIAAATRGPALVAPYLPQSLGQPAERLQGEILRKQREGNRLLLKVGTAKGPMLVTFTQKVPELDLLLEVGDTVTLGATGYATFVEDPILDRVNQSGRVGVAPSTPPPASSSPPAPKDKAVR